MAGWASTVAVLNASIAAAQAASVRALLFAVQPVFDSGEFHDIDEGINADGVIDPASAGFLRRALDVTETLEWPPELDAHAERLGHALEDLLAPLLDDDVQAAEVPARVAHDLAHDFGVAIDAYLSGEDVPAPSDLPTGDASQDDDHDEEDDDHEE